MEPMWGVIFFSKCVRRFSEQNNFDFAGILNKAHHGLIAG
jgi:hypothetical protein